jgi:ABC-type antimicrobial peptide transport system permease subunit
MFFPTSRLFRILHRYSIRMHSDHGAFLLVAIGLLIGIPLAIGAGRLMAAQLFEVRSWDPHVFGFSILALGVCAAAASILPAHRAASTDPLKALRTD